MKYLRFNLPQLLALMLAVGSIISFVHIWKSDEIVWRSNPLQYHVPIVPTEFDDKGRPGPDFSYGASLCPGTIVKFENGHQFYRATHREGWDFCRYKFYESKTFSRAYKLPPLSDDT